MKSLRDYLEESEYAADNPLEGDTFAINIREECLIESVVLESRNDGVVIAADDRMIELLESYGYTFEQTCMECGMMGCGCSSSEQHSDTADQDPGEYDQEGSMAKDDLNTIVTAARRLMGLLGDNDNMPEWTQSKIDRAADYVDTAADYIASKKTRGMDENEVDENVLASLPRPNKRNQFKGLHKLKKSHNENVEEGQLPETAKQDSPVARAILHRILMQHTGMLAAHGPERVMAAVDELADSVNIGPDDEIGTSDVSGYVRQVQQMLDSPREQGMTEDELDEGIRDKLAAAALAGTMALGAGGAQAKVIPGVQDGFASGFGGKPVATQMAPSTSSASATGSLNAQSAASREVAKQVRNAADQFKYTNPSFAQEYKRIETTYEKIKSIVYNNKRSSSSDTDLAKRQHAESIKTLIAADMEFAKDTNALMKQYGLKEQGMAEAEYQGRKVPLGKPMQGDVKKSKVYVKNPQGNIVKVNFGDPNMTIKKSNPARRKSFRARHNCDNPGPRTKARYWSCRAW